MSNEEQKLLPCPFCGASAEGFRLGKTGMPKLEELSEGGWRVSCYTCRMGHWQAFATETEAVAAWNTRSTPTNKQPTLSGDVEQRAREIERRDREREKTLRAMHLHDDGDNQFIFNAGWDAALTQSSEREQAAGRVEIPLDHPLAKALQLSPEAIAKIEEIERMCAEARARLSNLTLSTPTSTEEAR